MSALEAALLALLIFAVAALYSSVGQAGASGYLAAMLVVGLPAAMMRPAALLLNVGVATVASLKYIRAGAFSWRTLLPFALSLVALRRLSAYGVQLVTNLEPVYAIVLAMVLLGEQRELTPLFYLGVAIILAAVFLHPLLNRNKPLQHAEILATSEAKGIVE